MNTEEQRQKRLDYLKQWRKAHPDYMKQWAAKRPGYFRKKDGEYYYRNKRYVNAIKESTPCADCGIIFPAECMDFDHVRGAKSSNIATLVRQHASLDAINIEIAKCDLVDATCHRLRTLSRRLSN